MNWAAPQLELGRYDPLSSSLTTDHPCDDRVVGRAGFPPPPAPPAERTRGGGDGHLPGRLEVVLQRCLLVSFTLLLSVTIVTLAEEARERRRR
jgi:hypothetical protein